MKANPFSPQDYQSRTLHSARDALIFGLESAFLRADETFTDITEEEYHWETIPQNERQQDIVIDAETKRVWRVFPVNGVYTYDYGERAPDNPAFTTIAWIMNHIATTADMYLYCIQSGKPVGEGRTWGDLTIYATLVETRNYVFRALQDTRDYLLGLSNDAPLNGFTPAPWGEMRPTYLNLWTGIIEHALMHTMQIAVRKEYIRQVF